MASTAEQSPEGRTCRHNATVEGLKGELRGRQPPAGRRRQPGGPGGTAL